MQLEIAAGHGPGTGQSEEAFKLFEVYFAGDVPQEDQKRLTCREEKEVVSSGFVSGCWSGPEASE